MIYIDYNIFYAIIKELDRLKLKYISITIKKDIFIIYNYYIRKFSYRSNINIRLSNVRPASRLY